MKLYSQAFELKAIRTITSGAGAANAEDGTLEINERTKASALLLSSIDESFFYFEPCKAAYSRILTISKKRGQIVTYDDLLEDPALDEEFRDILRENRKKSSLSVDNAQRLLEGLDKYRKVRSLYFLAKEVIESVTDTSVDVDALLDKVTNSLTHIRSRDNVGESIRTVGKDANGLDLIDEALSTEDDVLLKTGYREFDEKNGGLPSEGVFILAATTSGGKSVFRMNLMSNIYLLNSVDCLTVSLEMNAKKETRRLLSHKTQIPFWKYVKQRLEKSERRASRKAWRLFHEHGKTNDCRYSILCPSRGVTITQLLMMIKPYGFKAIAIDYISLLEGVSEDNQWRVLGDIVRECKIFTTENHCLIMLLAQLDSEDDRVRYSKAIVEHADNAWTFNYSKPEQRDKHEIPIRQLKARDQEIYGFTLAERYDVMTVMNMDDPRVGERTNSASGDTTYQTTSGHSEDDPLSGNAKMKFEDGVG